LTGRNKDKFIKLQNDIAELVAQAINTEPFGTDELYEITNHIITTVMVALVD